MLNVESNLSRFWGWAKRWKGGATGHKRTEITVETDKVLIIRRPRSIRAWCAECGRDVDMVGREEAEALKGISATVLRDCVTGWHISQTKDGNRLVCLKSLLKSK